MATRQVTELDFRSPEYRDAKPEDFEFRADGKLARKDRWERGVNSIRQLVGISSREFEIADVVETVRKLAADCEGWVPIQDEYPDVDVKVSLRLSDGSILRNVALAPEKLWIWDGRELSVKTGFHAVAWREVD